MRAPLAHSPSITHGGALVPLDTANSRKLLYSNPRLLHSSPLGVTCPYTPGAKHRRFSLAVPILPVEASEARPPRKSPLLAATPDRTATAERLLGRRQRAALRRGDEEDLV